MVFLLNLILRRNAQGDVPSYTGLTDEEIANLKRFGNRQAGVAQARTPIEPVALSEFPPEVTRAFPSLVELRKQDNAALAELVHKLNLNVSD